jgi:membrane-associated phospholipid phosphatase
VADSAHLLQSPFAAMPSGHVAFALIAGGTFTVLGDRRWLRGFGRAYPPLVVTVTIVTGHHLWLDAVGAVLVVATASAVVVSLRRAATCAPPERSPSSAAVRRSGPWTEHPEGKSCAAVSRS